MDFFNPLIAFFSTPIGIVALVALAVLAGRFLWHLLAGVLHVALIVGILAIIAYGLGGFDDLVQPTQVQHQTAYRGRRI